MARIRTIKPEFFTSEDICALSPLARLFFQACWCEADREGRMEWKPRTMKLRYFPADNCDIEAIADEVVGRGLVTPYEVAGKQYAEVTAFTKHQSVNPRESVSKIPGRPRECEGLTRADASNPDVNAQRGKEGKGKEENPNPQTPLPSESPEPAAASVGQDDIDQIRVAVWRQSGLTEDQITTKLVTMNGDGIRQARTWLEAHPLQTILDAIAEAYDGAEKRGDAIRKPWAYLGTVVAGIAEKKAQEAAAPVVRDKWKDRRALFESGAWPPPWGPPPGQSGCEAPQWVQEIYINAKKGRAA